MPNTYIVLNMDCVFGMLDRLDEFSADAIVTDPPYNLSKDLPDSGGVSLFTNKGEWDTFKDEKEFTDFTHSWLESAYKILKDSGHIFIFCTHHNLFVTKKLLDEVGFRFRQLLVWYAPNSPPNMTNKTFCYCSEYILWATKGDNYTFNNTKERGLNFTKQIRDTFIINSLSTTDKERVEGHPTQKPTELLRQLIEVSTNENELVLDCFLGSGSTMLACIQTKRNCFGFEANKAYIPIIQKKVNWNQSPNSYSLIEIQDSLPKVDESLINKYMKEYKGVLTRNDIMQMILNGNLR